MWIEQSGLQFWNLWGGEFGIQSRGLEGPFLFFKHLWTENSSLGCKCTNICCLTQLWVKKWLPKQLLKNIELFSLFHSKCLVQKKHIIYIYVCVPTFAQTKKYTDRLFRGFVFVMCDVCATKHVHYNSVVAGKKTCSPNPKTNGSYEGSLLKNPSHESGKHAMKKESKCIAKPSPSNMSKGFSKAKAI